MVVRVRYARHRRKQVEIEQTDLAPVGADQDEKASRKLVKAKQLVWKTVPLLDEKGMLRRAENPLAQYGIDVTQVLICGSHSANIAHSTLSLPD